MSDLQESGEFAEESATTVEETRTDAGHGTQPSRERPLWHSPLFGLDPRRTVGAVAILLAFVALFVASHLATTVSVGGRPLETTSPAFDTLSAIVILFATVLMVVGPILYAVWNGGPIVAVTLASVPVVLAEIVAGRYVLGLDAAIALTTAVAGCVLASYVVDVDRTGSLRPWSQVDCSLERLLAVTVVTVVGAVSVWRFVAVAPSALQSAYLPFGVLWLVPAVLTSRYWLARVGPSTRPSASASS